MYQLSWRIHKRINKTLGAIVEAGCTVIVLALKFAMFCKEIQQVPKGVNRIVRKEY